MRLMILNGSLGGANGNTARLLSRFARECERRPEPGGSNSARFFEVEIVHLVEGSPSRDELSRADAFCFSTGTYWDSWGSPLQRFLEEATALEGDSCWFGKPTCAIVTMHSVGGKEVLSRLQGVLNTFGLYVPPMSALAYSLAGDLALREPNSSDHGEDFWSLGDLSVLAANLKMAASLKTSWSKWPVDHRDPKRIWLTDVSS